MDFVAVVDQVLALLRQRGRVTYSTLKRQFQLDDAALEDVKNELIEGQRLALDERGNVLVWAGGGGAALAPPALIGPGAQPLATPADPAAQAASPAVVSSLPDAERRQLTILFCDLVDSTALASQLDPEELREVMRAYQDTCAKVIARFEGHIAQYLGDGLLVYFGYPLAHEDDAQRAVRAGLGMVEALGQLNTRLAQEGATLSCRPSAVADVGNGLRPAPPQSRQRGVHLAVRLGIHTGLVVVGDIGSGTRQEQLALGETPNLAARLQSIATPNTLVISAATFQLLGGFFACQPLGTPLLKGIDQPLAVYRVLYESMARSRLEATGSTGWTPLVGREQEVGLLLERWARVKEGVGQVVLLSGEAGIGKSRLVQVLTEQAATEAQAWLTPCQCSPYYQNTALYPMIDLLERVALHFEREESPQQKLGKLEGFLVQYGLPLAEAVPLFAALLSLPLPADYAPLTMSPEQQKQMTLHALLTILLRIAAQQPVLFIMEDLHWVDPSTLELLSLLVDQGPTARILALLTFRPDFSPPWTGRSHLTQVTLHRLTHPQAAELLRRMAHHKALPPEVAEQIVAKTDGIPLFVEELTKMVLESGLLQEREDRYELMGPLPALAIPATLQDSLMARLDRLTTVKAVAQLGATIGRTFAYDLLQAVALLDDATLQQGLRQLIAVELVYQRGVPPQATYTFKHALIQDAAYQSLLKSTRQQYHQRIAQVLEALFPEITGTQPELLAHHYTEAGLGEQAIGYWQRAGQRALACSAYVEAISHVTQGLEILRALPNTAEHTQHELDLQLIVGLALMVSKTYSAPEVEQAYARAYELCRQVGDTPQVFPALWGLWVFNCVVAKMHTAQELGKQCLTLAQRVQDPALLLQADHALGVTLVYLGDLAPARVRLEQGIALYDVQRHHAQTVLYGGHDPGVCCLVHAAWVLWLLGYPAQALMRGQEAHALARVLAHPFSVTHALQWTAMLAQLCRDIQTTQELTEAAIALSMEQGFAGYTAGVTLVRGWAQVHQGQDEGITQITQGLAALRAMGSEYLSTYYLGVLAEAYGHVGHPEAGLRVLTEALVAAHNTGVRYYEAELHRLRGVLLLQHIAPDAQHVEACFHQALDVARHQQAKSLELRTAMSLSRLWQQQGKQAEAYALLAPIYGWFTEGFDTADLQEAKTLLEELA